MTIEALETPGHLDDHMSFLIREESTLVSGDIILGSPSCAIEDLDAYFQTLAKLSFLDLEWILLPHSVSLASPDQIRVPAAKKI